MPKHEAGAEAGLGTAPFGGCLVLGREAVMDIVKWISQAKDLRVSALGQASEALGAGVGFVKSAIGPAWLFGSTETSSSYDHDRVDEKHYFLIPDRRSRVGYSLYTMRCLPDGVPPINDLPKRRLFHLPNEHALPTVEHILLADARETAAETPAAPGALGSRLKCVADQIDRLDGKVFNGVLLIGGLVALINPLAGAAVAVKALIPSLGMLFTKFGLKYVGDTANARDMAKRIRNAEKDVLRRFRESGTETLVNPLLAQLDRALETSVRQYEPILDFEPEEMEFGQRDRERLFALTCQAIANTYGLRRIGHERIAAARSRCSSRFHVGRLTGIVRIPAPSAGRAGVCWLHGRRPLFLPGAG